MYTELVIHFTSSKFEQCQISLQNLNNHICDYTEVDTYFSTSIEFLQNSLHIESRRRSLCYTYSHWS